MRTVANQTHYRDVLVFLDRLRDLAILKGDDIVRSNIHASLRGSALAWYSTELTDFERSSLRHMPLEEGWFKMLRQRFKMRPSMALAKLTEATYTPADVRAGKSVRSFAQSIFRYALAADITSVFNQITQAWSKLSPQLRRDVPEPTPQTTMTEFLTQLEAKEAIWKDIAQVQPPRGYTRTYPEYQPNQWQSRPNGNSRAQWTRQNGNRQPGQWQGNNRQYIRPQNQNAQGRDETHRPQGGLRPPLLLTDKPANTPSGQNDRFKGNRQPWTRYQQGGNQHPGMQQRPSSYPRASNAYQAEIPFEDSETSLQVDARLDVSSHYGSEYSTDYPEDCMRSDDVLDIYNDFTRTDPGWCERRDNIHNDTEEAVTCLQCHNDFPSNNILHAHLRECDDAPATAFQVATSDDVIESCRRDYDRPGYRFRPWRYVSAQVFLLNNKENWNARASRASPGYRITWYKQKVRYISIPSLDLFLLFSFRLRQALLLLELELHPIIQCFFHIDP